MTKYDLAFFMTTKAHDKNHKMLIVVNYKLFILCKTNHYIYSSIECFTYITLGGVSLQFFLLHKNMAPENFCEHNRVENYVFCILMATLLQALQGNTDVYHILLAAPNVIKIC